MSSATCSACGGVFWSGAGERTCQWCAPAAAAADAARARGGAMALGMIGAAVAWGELAKRDAARVAK